MSTLAQQNEQNRLKALKLYGILDTLPEEEFDNITHLASEICQTPIALISLVDENRQWFKSRVGLDVGETNRDIAFCAHAINDDAIFEVDNPDEDARFAGNPLVTGYPFVRYYAGAPIINKDGHRLGTLCVINSQPHHLTDEQKRSLRILADSVMSILELRYKQKEADFFRNALDEVAAVCVIDNESIFEYANEKFCALAEAPCEEIIGKHYNDITLSDVTEQHRDQILADVKAGKIFRGRIKNQNKKGDISWSNTTVIPFMNSRNEIIKLFSMRVDITTEVRMVEKLEAAEKLSKTGNWEVNLVNGHKHWSKGMFALIDYPDGEIPAVTPTLVDFLVPDDKIKIEQGIMAAIRGEENFAVNEVTIISKDAKTKCLAISTKTTKNASGNVIMFSGTLQDITERKETEAKYRSLVEETSQMTFITDREGRYTYASPRLKKVIGFEDEDILGKQFSFIYDDDWRKKTIQFYIQQLSEKKNETNYIFPIKTKEGEKVWFEQIATLITDNDEITGFRCVLHDITDRVNTENTMREAARLATEAKEMQQSFLGKMSHEIRTPMNGVVGMVNLLKATPLNDKQQIYVNGISESATNLLRIINDILDVSKIESGKMTFEETSFDLVKLVNNVLLTIKPSADDKGIILASSIDSQIPATLVADPLRLNQVLLNLAGNALKFTEKGSVIINIGQLSVNGDSTTLVVKVIDTGIGIHEHKLESIFESFTQADAFTTRKYGGTGLGLTIARQLIEQQNGTITVESEVGRGTTFTFTYHCRLSTGETESTPPAPQARPSALSSLKGARILLVEDNIINQMVAQHTIENWEASITIADRGYKAIELLKTQQFDIILMDIQMPEMSGIQATKIIRDELGVTTPIIAMTASAMKGEKDVCIVAGMNDYFPKPFEQEDLHRMLRKYLAGTKKEEHAKLFDAAAFLDLVGNDIHFARQLLSLFVSRTPGMLKDIEKNVEQSNYGQLFTEIHNIKGTVGFFGKRELDNLLVDIEKDLIDLQFNERTAQNLTTLTNKLNQLMAEAVMEIELL
ncbi:MAG: PAS domain S-box protein [Bacteroidota bacterium]